MIITVPNLWNYDRYGPGVITEWYKNEGDKVRKKDPLCQIMVIKATYIVESPVDGVLKKIIATKGMKVKPGDPLAEVEEAAVVPPPAAVVPQPQVVTEVKPEIKPAPSEEYSVVKIEGIRKTIADRMVESLRGMAQYTLHTEIDASELVKLRETRFRDYTYTELLSYIVVKALKDYPMLNAHVVNDELRIFKHVHLGIGVQTDRGLLVGVVKNADEMDLDTLVKNMRKVIDDVRQGKATVEELTGSTFTISNLGMTEVTFFTPIINPPEVAILGVGKIRDVFGKKYLPLSLTLDHRVIDGYIGAQFLGKLKELIENPQRVFPGIAPGVARLQEKLYKLTATSLSDTKIEVTIGKHKLIVEEEPVSSIEYLLLSLVGCMNLTIRMIARERGININSMEFSVVGTLNPAKFLGLTETGRAGLTQINVDIKIASTAPRDVIESMIKEATERCPAHDTLTHGTQINTKLELVTT